MIVIGLMSGTSLDGVDAAMVKIQRRKQALQVRLQAFASLAYPPALRNRLLIVSERGTVSEICHLNVVVGEVFAKAARKVIRRSGLSPRDIHLIGSHGQTIHHRPQIVHEQGVGPIRSTFQIGEPAVIAERTGIPTMGNFRARDMAAGGEGAPLAPYVHHLLFHHRSRTRLVVNLGGIVNVTLVPAERHRDTIKAFDVGPCNMLLDGIIHHLSHGKSVMDRGGRNAKGGRVLPTLLKELWSHPYMERIPPKSTGREDFGREFLKPLLKKIKRNQWSTDNVLMTCCHFVASSITMSQQWFRYPIEEVIVGGGGVHNRVLMAQLANAFHPLSVKRMEEYGSHSKAFEAKAFAILAYQSFYGIPNNVPSVTGARHPVILGTLVPAVPHKHPASW